MEGKNEEEVNGIRLLAELGALRLSRLIRDRGEPELLEKYEYLLLPDADWQEIWEAEYATLIDSQNNEDAMGARMLRIAAHCGGDVALVLLELIMLKLEEPEADELLELVSKGNGKGVTLLTAARTAGYTGTLDTAMLPMKEAEEAASFLLSSEKGKDGSFFSRTWSGDSYLMGFLSGAEMKDPLTAEFTENWSPADGPVICFGMEERLKGLAENMRRLMDNEADRPFALIVDGERGSGRHTAVKALCEMLGVSLLTVDFSFLLGHKDPKDAIRRIVRSAALEGRALCVRNIKKQEDTLFLLERMEAKYREHCVLPLFLITGGDVKLVPMLKERWLSLRIPKGNELSLALWKGFFAEAPEGFPEAMASKMSLTAGQIKRVAQASEMLRSTGEVVDERRICRLCYEVLDDGRYENVKWVEPGFTFDDLKIDPQNKEILMEICRQASLRRKVYDEWGLRRQYAYGRAVSAILAGPPGTGKTMTVHALASFLGLELYKVDLSQVVDKYVGETEKRLDEVFDRAEKSNMILFFDEADAVMGKRSEVKDAQDRYANTEISFILQRIEEFDGIVLLSTNNLQNIDRAFMRRIRYVLTYELPNPETRREIWLSAFGDKVPLSEDIDLDFLTEKFDLSGGEIKNVVLNAVFCAAAEGKKVSMEHIMKAIYRESTKTKRIAFDGDYGKYAYMMRG